MAINQGGKAKSITWTAVGGQSPTPPAGPITTIQNIDFSEEQALAEFLLGTSRVQSHYSGTVSATIMIETSDLAKLAGLRVGQKFDNVDLILEAARDSANVLIGGDFRIRLSSAVISEKGALSKGNEDGAPIVGSVTFKLDKRADAVADPTFSIEAV